MANILSITITDKKRVWCDVTVHGEKYDFKTRTRRTSVEGLPVGERIKVTGEVKREYNGYGVTTELIILSEQELADEKRKQAEAYMDTIRTRAEKTGCFARTLADKIDRSVYGDYKAELDRIYRDTEIRRWTEYFRKNYNDGYGYIYERSVDELHKLGCHDLDEEIANARQTIIRKKLERKAQKEAEEKANGIVELVLPAYDGFEGRPAKGSLLLHKDRVYRVISSYYHREDGFSFGALNDEWYSVKAQDVSDSPEGRERLEQHARERAKSAAEARFQQSIRALVGSVMDSGQFYRPGGPVSVDDVPGELLFDSFNIYGGGYQIRSDDDIVYAVTNNGADGDAWDINNLRTGGAGAYAFFAPRSDVAEQFNEFIQAREEKEKFA